MPNRSTNKVAAERRAAVEAKARAGLTPKEIAYDLGVSHRHVCTLMTRLGIRWVALLPGEAEKLGRVA